MPCMFFGGLVIAETEVMGGKTEVICVGCGNGLYVFVGLGFGMRVLEGVGVGFGVGFLTRTPLLQTNFFPDLIHVYCLFK